MEANTAPETTATEYAQDKYYMLTGKFSDFHTYADFNAFKTMCQKNTPKTDKDCENEYNMIVKYPSKLIKMDNNKLIFEPNYSWHSFNGKTTIEIDTNDNTTGITIGDEVKEGGRSKKNKRSKNKNKSNKKNKKSNKNRKYIK